MLTQKAQAGEMFADNDADNESRLTWLYNSIVASCGMWGWGLSGGREGGGMGLNCQSPRVLSVT